MKSSLTDVTILTNHYSSRNGTKIDKITIHHMAGNLSAETCGKVFKTRKASTNYGIGSDGRVGCYVLEENRAWSTTNSANDRRAINIEVANDVIGGSWHVSDKALAKCIDLCVDICKRHGIKKLNYTGGKDGNLTRHNMFMSTSCPGPYLQSKFPYIADEVNKRLNGSTPTPEPTPVNKDEYQTYDNDKKKWLPKVKIGSTDYAGNFGNTVGGLRLEGHKYRVHLKNGKWLSWITKADNTSQGYAGIYGKDIDGVQIENATYRVHIKNGGWLSWINKVDDTSMGYAGIYGKAIDAIQIK